MAENEEVVEDVISDAEASDAEASDAEASDVASESEASESEASESEASDIEDEEENPLADEGLRSGLENPLAEPLGEPSGVEGLRSGLENPLAKKKGKSIKKKTAVIFEEDEEEEGEDDNYLQKFDNEMRDNFVLNYHPEARTHNYEEVKALARVSRDGRGIIIDPLHKTLPFLTKYEMTRVIGQRAKQIDSGAKTFVKVPLNMIDGYHIAVLELEQKKLPFIIKRPFPNGGIEYWNVGDLEML